MPPSEQQTFAQRLRRLRLERGLPQGALATDGVSASYISLLESGRRSPTDKAVRALAQRLGCSVDELKHGAGAGELEELELAARYIDLAIENGEADEALSRLAATDRTRDRMPVPPALALRLDAAVARALELAGRIEEAIDAYGPVGDTARRLGDVERWVQSAVALTRCLREVGDLGRSLEFGEAALRELDGRGLRQTDLGVELAATVLFSYYERGDLATARRMADRAIRDAETVGSHRARGAAYWNASVIASEAGHQREALALADRALAILGEGADERNLSRLRSTLGSLLLRQDPPDVEQALPLLEAAIARLRASSASEVEVAYSETELARAQLLGGRSVQAAETARAALRRLGPAPRLETPRVRAVLAAALLAGREDSQARSAYRLAARELRALGASRQAAAVWRELGDGLLALGLTEDALEAFREAMDQAGVPGPALPFGQGPRSGAETPAPDPASLVAG